MFAVELVPEWKRSLNQHLPSYIAIHSTQSSSSLPTVILVSLLYKFWCYTNVCIIFFLTSTFQIDMESGHQGMYIHVHVPTYLLVDFLRLSASYDLSFFFFQTPLQIFFVKTINQLRRGFLLFSRKDTHILVSMGGLQYTRLLDSLNDQNPNNPRL